MNRLQNNKKRVRCRGRRGSSVVESVLVILGVSLLFWYLFLVFDLAMIKIVGQHSAFVMGRSHIVGFNNDITKRAARVGAIPISGNLEFPTQAELGIRSNIELGMWDPHMISCYIQELPITAIGGDGTTMRYQHWDHLAIQRPTTGGSNQDNALYATTFKIDRPSRSDYENGDNDYINNQAPDKHRISLIPGIWYFIRRDIEIRSEVRMRNHAGYYLE